MGIYLPFKRIHCIKTNDTEKEKKVKMKRRMRNAISKYTRNTVKNEKSPAWHQHRKIERYS